MIPLGCWKTNAPLIVGVKLNEKQLILAKEGRLGLIDSFSEKKNESFIPIQLESRDDHESLSATFFLPKGDLVQLKYELVESKSPVIAKIEAILDSKTGQLIFEEDGNMVMQYNYQTVYEKDVIRPGSSTGYKIDYSNKMSGIYIDEYLKCHPEFPKDTIVTSAIYAIPRSNYIHPLYGLNGEMLTNDWPDAGHPHHRGIFWAWPEVEYGTRRGDIYALQTVFARPTGNVSYTSGPVYAQVKAENLWMWEDNEPIVKENVTIRVYRSNAESRIIDLTINLLALEDSVTIATRFTNSYGGLNIRMQSPAFQDISYFTDEEGTQPVSAWSDFNGIFEGQQIKSGLMVLQHQDNPEYPGSWRDYPELAWVQPTFPTPNTRYPLSTQESLTLRYRLIVHAGGKPDEDISRARWDVFN